MKNKGKIGEEILGHLNLYKDLGVRYADPAPALARRHAGTAKGDAEKTGRAGAQGSRPITKPAPPVLISRVSMFDDLPTGREELEAIRQDLGDCRRCKLSPGRTNIVFGSGNPHAELMFVGEAPGADEDAQGLPFVGRAGQLLSKIIEAISMSRGDVYICNILKCRPPGNRNPESDEIGACEPFLFRQIASVKPRVICALGTFGAQTLLGTKEPISRLRGHFFEFRGAKLMATFHPAYLLRNPNEKRKVWEDIQKIRDYLKSLH
jgi:uracil-DNA glycosylase family 4